MKSKPTEWGHMKSPKPLTAAHRAAFPDRLLNSMSTALPSQSCKEQSPFCEQCHCPTSKEIATKLNARV